MLDLIIKFVLAILTYGAITFLIFAMFKLPIKGNDKQITIAALAVGSVNFYFQFIIESPYHFIYQILTLVIILTVLRKYPILYSIIISIIGFIAAALIDVIVSLVGQSLSLFTIDQLQNDITTYSLVHLAATILYAVLALMLIKTRFGFSFVKNRFSTKNKQPFSNKNYLWAISLILVMMLITFVTQPSVINSLNLYIILLVGILFIINIWYAYKQNKISLKDRYGK